MSLHVNTCIAWYYMMLHALHQIRSNYMGYIQLLDITCQYMHSLTLDYMCYVSLHDIICSPSPTGGNKQQINPPVPPPLARFNHPPIPAQPAARP